MGGGPKTLLDPAGLLKGKPVTPEPVDPNQVATDSLATQMRLAPDVYKANAEYQPKYAALDQQLLNDSLFGGNGAPGLIEMYGKAGTALSGQDAAANTAQRTADIADVNALGGLARQAYNNANPELAAMMGSLGNNISAQRNAAVQQVTPDWAGAGNLGMAQNARAGRLGQAAQAQVTDATTQPLSPATGYSAANLTATGASDSALTPGLIKNAQGFADKTSLQTELERQAAEGLSNGGALSASELSKAQQDVRSAYAARGLNDGNGAIGAEILNTDAARQAKLNTSRTFAQGVDAAGQQTLNANRTFATGMEDSLLNRNQFNANAANQAGALNASAENQARATNAGAANQFALTQYGTQANTDLTNAAARNAASATNAGAANQFALTQFGQNADTSKTNAAAQNQFALTQYGTNADLSRSNSALSLQAQMANMDYGRATTNDQFAREFQLAQMQQSQAQDPFQMVLGRSGVPAQSANAAANAAYTQNAAPKLFDPFNSAITSIYAGNAANAAAANTTNANNQSANQGAMIGAGATLLVAL